MFRASKPLGSKLLGVGALRGEPVLGSQVVLFPKARRIALVQPTHSPGKVVPELFVGNMGGFLSCAGCRLQRPSWQVMILKQRVRTELCLSVSQGVGKASRFLFVGNPSESSSYCTSVDDNKK